MKKTAITSILPYLKKSRIIGIGTTSICFLMNNGNVLKLFINTNNRKELFKYRSDIIYHFDQISTINNDTYIAPLELLIKDNNLVGYIMTYKNVKNIGKITSDIPLSYILNEYDKLQEDTIKVSKLKYSLNDLHEKNILFNGSYYLIDLDNGYFDEVLTEEELLNHNMAMINDVIIHSLLGVKLDKVISFNDKEINKLYKKSTISDYKYIKELFFLLKKIYNCDTKRQLCKKKSKILEINDNYYSF